MTILKQGSLEIQVSGPEGRDCASSCPHLKGPKIFLPPYHCDLYKLNQNYTPEGTASIFRRRQYTAFRCNECISKFGLVKE